MSPERSSKIRGEFCIESRAEPGGVVIFGASGDLTSRKLMPALFNLYRRNLLPRNFYVLGCGRSRLTDEAFAFHVRDEFGRIAEFHSDPRLDDFLRQCYYSTGDYDDPAFYDHLRERLGELDGRHATGGNHLFYCSTPPSVYAAIADRLSGAGLAAEGEGGRPWRRVVIEKPFGRDLQSAAALDAELHKVLRERQIYRIDHYLGKETVQNILMFRFANAIFEPIWNRRYVDHVQIMVAESLGVDHRAGYYEKAGALRDMFQNHMLQMLSLVAMEPPTSFDADHVRDEKVKLLRALRPFDPGRANETLVRGQYGPGAMGGKEVPGYLEEPGVDPQSTTETYLAMRLMVDNWRWQGVPFYLRSGKRLCRRVSQIAIAFKPVPHSMFSPIAPEEFEPNLLLLNVQPDEGVSLRIQSKHPGPKLCMSALTMDFTYREAFEEEPPEAYERLLLDCMLGDQTLFVRHDDVIVSWALMTPVLEALADPARQIPLCSYDPGSWGPKEADELLGRDGRVWFNP
ncbi:MAG: glucose-6-phosphate dehydrogenase [bacterium]|nr:glucose-6-phosphate dehydrogenase [bacterium]